MASAAPGGSSRDKRVATKDSKSGDPRPNAVEMMAHPFKTAHFIGALGGDKRISWIRKALYVAPIVLLFVALLIPEGVIAAAVSVLLPFVGPAVDLPADAVVDWVFIGLAAYALLGVLPRLIVAEHHERIFHPRRFAAH